MPMNETTATSHRETAEAEDLWRTRAEPRAARRIALSAFAILVGLGTAQCACGRDAKAPVEGPAATAPTPDTAPAPETPARAEVKLPAGLETGDLDADERALLAEVLREQFDPCGKPRSFYDALEDAESCEAARSLAKLAVNRVADGWSKRQVVTALLGELTKRARSFAFELDDAPCHGERKEGQRVIVEFSDFQCPHCAKAFKPVKELAERHGALLCAKQLPLDFHTFAKPAALAALAAHAQGRFWDYAAELYARQDALGEEVFSAIAKELGLDLERFATDRASELTAAKLARDLAEADAAEVDGTPAFFVDGLPVEFEQLEDALAAPRAE
jgi:predicted DsbA family dithiol-disulfide isomerase